MRLLLLTLFFSLSLYSQEPKEILKRIQTQLDKVNDFSADLNVHIEISYVNVPDKVGKIYYKKPNQTKVDIDGFSFLPKQGVGNFVGDIISEENLNVFQSGQEELEKANTIILTVIPLDQPNGIVLVRLWADTERDIVLKAEITTKEQGTFDILMEYDKIDQMYYLPSKTTVKFKLDNFSIPTAFVSAQDKQKVKDMKGEGEHTKGKIELSYTNYSVNKGISDSIFSE